MPNGDGTGPLGNGCRGGRLKQSQQNGNEMGKGRGRKLGICHKKKNQLNVNESDTLSKEKGAV